MNCCCNNPLRLAEHGDNPTSRQLFWLGVAFAVTTGASLAWAMWKLL